MPSVSGPDAQEHMVHVLERENYAIALGVGLALYTNFAVDHGHDSVPKFLMNESLDGSTINEHALRNRSISMDEVSTSVMRRTSKRR